MKRIITSMLCLGLLLILGGCGKKITQQEALELALQDAGVKQEDVTILAEKMEEDGYEFSFQSEEYIFNYELEGNGEIKEKSKAQRQKVQSESTQPQSQAPSNSNEPSEGTKITQEEAKTIAYEYFSISPDSVTNLHVKEDMERGRLVYDIEFDSGANEYSCEVDVMTKEIVSSDIDPIG